MEQETSKYPLSAHPNDGRPVYGQRATRDLVGYAGRPPTVKWPKSAKVALNLVLNYEEGAEKCLLHGDQESEKLLSEIVGASAYANERHANMESLYDYGSRAGFWRIHDLLRRKGATCTVFAVGMALERNPDAARAMVDAGWEIGERPVGIYQGKPNVNTRRLVVEEGGFLYDSDSYADDLPYWTNEFGDRPHLIVPYTLSENDMRFAIPNGFSNGHEFFVKLKDSLDYLLEEGRRGSPKMMSVGLHCRLVGRPGRAKGLEEFLDYVQSLGDDVWVCR
ncbi:hypothetical protein THAOC_15752, partial [Thalassiosira oceanica]